MDEFWKVVGHWATTQTFEHVILLVVALASIMYGPEWLKVILEHWRETKKINHDEQRRTEQTAQDIKAKLERRRARAKQVQRDRRGK